MKSSKSFQNSRPHAGFSLVEVLVALLVLSVGLLGLAALQTTSLQFNTGSYYRTQATFLAYDILDRMRANSGVIADSDGTGYDQPATTYVTMTTNCDSAACTSADLALYDVRKWYDRAVATLPDAVNNPPTINIDATRRATIIIRWVERDIRFSQTWVAQL